MAYMVKRDFPRLIQPQYPARIDTSGQLFDPTKLSCVINPGSSKKVDALSGKIYTVSSSPAVATTSQGKGINWVVNTNDYIEIDTDADNVLDTVSCSMLIATVRTSANVYAGSLYGYYLGVTNISHVYLPYSDSKIYWDFGASNATGRVSVSVSSYLAAGTVNIWGFSAGARGREIWRNGKLLASAPTATATRAATTAPYRIGTTTQAGQQLAPAHSDSLFVLSKEEWSQNTFAELTNNPWQIFAPRQRNIYVSVASGAAALAGNATDTATTTGALTTDIQIIGASASISTATGALDTGIPLDGISASVSTADGTLSAQIKFYAAALSVASAAGALDTVIQLDGAGIGASASTGSITTQIVLSGGAISAALATGDLTTVPDGLAGAASTLSSAGGALTTQIPLAGAASALSISTGGLTTGIPLDGVSAAVSHVTGDLTISITMSTDAIAQSVANGSLSTLVQLSASSLSVALATGVLTAGASSWLGDTITFTSAIRTSVNFTSAIRKQINFTSAI